MGYVFAGILGRYHLAAMIEFVLTDRPEIQNQLEFDQFRRKTSDGDAEKEIDATKRATAQGGTTIRFAGSSCRADHQTCS